MTERNAERERLIELIIAASEGATTYCVGACEFCADKIADYLLANGVVVPPVKVGQTVYDIRKPAIKGHWHESRWIVDEWGEWKVCELPFSLTLWENGKLGDDYLLTREEAEKALAERSGNGN
jgi:hypothetical protein